ALYLAVRVPTIYHCYEDRGLRASMINDLHNPPVAYMHALTSLHTVPYLKCVRVEVLLQLLIGKVDAHLLERVALKDLKAKNIQDTDRAIALRRATERYTGTTHK